MKNRSKNRQKYIGREQMDNILDELQSVLVQRKTVDVDKSYVAGLYAKGLDKILQKIGEEATELVIAGKNKDKNAIIHEMADLWFHNMILLANNDIDYQAVIDELARRFGTSGIVEKNQRGQQ